MASSAIVKTNEGFIDGWTLVHAATGVLGAYFRLNPWIFAGGSLVYELAEFWHEYPSGSRLFGTKGPESTKNALTDLSAAFLAYAITLHLLRRD